VIGLQNWSDQNVVWRRVSANPPAVLKRAQADDAREKAKANGEGALKAVRAAWNHILYPVKSETSGKPFDLDHDPVAARDRAAIPVAVYDKFGPKGDNIAKEKLGPDTLWQI
jgi:hypothetical protein